MDAGRQGAAADARVAHIGEDPAFLRYPMRSFPQRSVDCGRRRRGAARAGGRTRSRAADSKARVEERRKWAMERARRARAKADARVRPMRRTSRRSI